MCCKFWDITTTGFSWEMDFLVWIEQELVRALPLPPFVFASWWCPRGVTWHAVPKLLW